MKFIVQARNNWGWDRSKYGGETIEEAREAEKELLANDAAWMPGQYKRETRIIEAAA